MYRAYHQEHTRQFELWVASGYDHYRKPNMPPLPPEVNDLRCEARTRAGTPCKRKDIYLNGRCRLHGGLSTGPTSDEGKQISSLNAKKREKP